MQNPGFNFQNTYTDLPSCFFTETKANSVKEPDLIILNEELCKDIDLDFNLITERETASLLSGNLFLCLFIKESKDCLLSLSSIYTPSGQRPRRI